MFKKNLSGNWKIQSSEKTNSSGKEISGPEYRSNDWYHASVPSTVLATLVDKFTDDNTVGYYYRDQKSIVTRVPQAYGGKGYYIGGNQKQMLDAGSWVLVIKLSR